MKSITKKSLYILSSASLVVLVVIFSISYYFAETYMDDKLESEIKEVNSALSTVLRQPIFTYDSQQLDDILLTFVSYSHIHKISAFDHRNKLLSESVDSTGEVVSSEDLLEHNIPILWEDNKVIGKVSITYRMDSKEKFLNVIKIVFSAIALALLIVLQMVNWYVLKCLVIRPIKVISDTLADIAEGGGDLTSRIDIKSDDELSQLARNFNSFIEQLHKLVSNVVGTANDVSKTSDSIMEHANNNAHATQRLFQETDLASTALSQMSLSSNEIAESADEAAKHTQDCNELATNGIEVVTNTAELIQKLNNSMTTSADKVSQQLNMSNSISSVLVVIVSIAEQTNLLALNAAIEAARAGEQGRGFAVVADEVRNLAKRTQEATTEIEQIILNLQQVATESNDSMEYSQKALKQALLESDKASQVLKDIADSIVMISGMNKQAAQASDEQNIVSADVSSNVTEVFNITNQVTLNAQGVKKESARLNKISKEMKNALLKFKL